ncbi:HflK protein [Thioclava sp. SK-1]|uniref:FtsH protease activity modulator HflK n=1 Tax=Thioclava sp. SK-1 TaxID=1889770 RepID=UPI000826EB49|nr:FtsH protease activity modulator HflK [Thioclava sp. SK-1]OCX66568.1 HflK protein [Thioclava sp. SK-1]
MSNPGPWGTGGGGGGDKDKPHDPGKRSGQRGPGNDQGIPEIEEFMKKGSEQLRVLMGGGGSGGRSNGGGRGPGGQGVGFGTLALIAVAAVGLWAWASFYTVRPEERSVELMFGREYSMGNPGLNFAPWPIVTHEIVQVTREQTVDVGSGRAGDNDTGLMLTGDQNIVDVEFQVVWNISDPSQYLFNLADAPDTIRAVSESAMRDIIARSELAPILNRDRGVIAADLRQAVQSTLDSYDAGINVIRVNFNRADPPSEVINSFRQVQAAQQERDRLEKEADAYANRVTAAARGQAAQLREEAEAYRAQTVNDAQGEAARFTSVYNEYVKAPDVTKRRMFLETMEGVLQGLDKVIVDQPSGGQGVVPYLPLNELNRSSNTTTTGGSN